MSEKYILIDTNLFDAQMRAQLSGRNRNKNGKYIQDDMASIRGEIKLTLDNSPKKNLLCSELD